MGTQFWKAQLGGSSARPYWILGMEQSYGNDSHIKGSANPIIVHKVWSLRDFQTLPQCITQPLTYTMHSTVGLILVRVLLK